MAMMTSSISTAVRSVVVALGSGEEPLRLDAFPAQGQILQRLMMPFVRCHCWGTGGLIVVRGGRKSFQTVFQSVVGGAHLGNFVVLVRDSLKKTSKLRAAAEGNPLYAAIGFYEEAGARPGRPCTDDCAKAMA